MDSYESRMRYPPQTIACKRRPDIGGRYDAYKMFSPVIIVFTRGNIGCGKGFIVLWFFSSWLSKFFLNLLFMKGSVCIKPKHFW